MDEKLMDFDAKQKQNKGTVLIASGASGGHLFPALAVADALRDEGYDCTFVMGGGKFMQLVTSRGYPLLRLPASGFNVRNPLRRMMAILRLAMGLWLAFRLVMRTKPKVVIGTGGYASVATILAAKAVGVPAVIHEQNVLPGRANRFLSKRVDLMLLTFSASKDHVDSHVKTVVTGMPLRAEVLAARGQQRDIEDSFGIMVLGGSMGARILSQVVPEMLAMMPQEERAKVRVIHQARPEDVAKVREDYSKLGLADVNVAAFYVNLPELYKDMHLIIGRSGAGTLLETALLGRAAIYVPHELADRHQFYNARVAEEAGAAVLMEQEMFTPANVLVQVRGLMRDRDRLAAMEAAALTLADVPATENVVNALKTLIFSQRGSKAEKIG